MLGPITCLNCKDGNQAEFSNDWVARAIALKI